MFYLLYHHQERIGSVVTNWSAVLHHISRGFDLIAESDDKRRLWQVFKII